MKSRRKSDSISVIAPNDFGNEEIRKAIKREVLTEGVIRKKSLEKIKSRKIVWMPYYHILYDYYSVNNAEGTEARSAETAMNAMYCDEAAAAGLEFRFFRPNYLNFNRSKYLPKDEDILGPILDIDLQETLNELVRALKKKEDNYSKKSRELIDLQKGVCRRFLLPTTGPEKKKSSQLSEKVAQSRAMEVALRMSLNIGEEKITSPKLKEHNIFYFPTLITALEHKTDESKRYLIFNLADKSSKSRSPKLDEVLSGACNKNKKFRKITRDLLNSE